VVVGCRIAILAIGRGSSWNTDKVRAANRENRDPAPPYFGTAPCAVPFFAAMIRAMLSRLAYLLLLLPCWQAPAFAQCAPAPDSAYFFRDLAEERAEARLTENRAFFENLLSESFSAKDVDGKTLLKQEYIDRQLAGHPAASHSGFYAVRDFQLDEHRKGVTVASYRLVQGDTGNNAHVTETWQREVYEVQDGKWRLVSVEKAEPRVPQGKEVGSPPVSP
jgi:hypothetical protein